MRYIDETIRARLLQAQKTLYNNANPSMEIIASRPQTPIIDKRLWQEVIVTPDVTSISTSVAIKKTGRIADKAYVAYVSDENTLVVKSAPIAYPVSSMIWTVVETIANCLACALEFDGHFVYGDMGVAYRTDELPWLFYISTSGALYGKILGDEVVQLAAANVTALDSIRGVASIYQDQDQGLAVFYIVDGIVYYNCLVSGTWEGQVELTLAPDNAVSLKAERTFDYRIVVQVMDNSGVITEVFSRMYAAGWNGTEYLELTEITASGAMLPIYYWDYATDEYIELSDITGDGWNYAEYAPTLLSARNLSTQIEDPENPGEYLTDWGYVVEFKFDQIIRNASAYPGDFKIVDAYTTWYGQSAVVSGQYVIVTFTDFNNANNPITATALAGNLSTGYLLLTETSVEFEATGLVPTYIPPPVPQSITNLASWEVTQ